MTPSDDRADKRAETPMGFVQATFEANYTLCTGRPLPSLLEAA